jgi:hypothetical protein
MSLDWTYMVSEYSNRHFTFDKDRLPALFGICQSTGFHPADCSAGIWRQAAEHQLLWYPANAAGKHELQVDRRNAPSVPSWSWIRVHKMVGFCTPLQEVIWQVISLRRDSTTAGANALRIKSRVASLKLLLKDHRIENPYGRALSQDMNLVNSDYNLQVTAQPLAGHEEQLGRPCWNFTLTVKLLKDFSVDWQRPVLPDFPDDLQRPFSRRHRLGGLAPSTHASGSAIDDDKFLLLFAGVVGANRVDGSVRSLTDADSVVGLVLRRKMSQSKPQGMHSEWERVGIFYDDVNGWPEWERWTREEELDIV